MPTEALPEPIAQSVRFEVTTETKRLVVYGHNTEHAKRRLRDAGIEFGEAIFRPRGYVDQGGTLRLPDDVYAESQIIDRSPSA
jgi:hypothetical protein